MLRFRACRLPFLVLLAALVGPAVRSQTITLDQTYYGSLFVYPFAPFTASFSAAGESPGAANGLAGLQLYDEGSLGWKDGAPDWYETDLSANSFVLRGRGDDRLIGIWYGRGFLPDLDGAFTITSGSGRFAGYRGSGAMSVRAAGWSAPATMAIHGTAYAVPEPPALALLGGVAGLGIIPARRRRIRSLR